MSYKIGITVHNFECENNLLQLEALLQNDLVPDFIIFHQQLYKRMILRVINCLTKRKTERKSELIKKIKNIKSFNIPDINSRRANKILKKHEPVLLISNSGYIKKSTIETLTDTFFINSHASKLPKYRGVSNIEWALWNKDDIYVTIHRINNGIDEGDILYQEKINIDFNNTASITDIKNNVLRIIPFITVRAINKFLNKETTFIKQDYIGEPLKQYYSMHPVLKQILAEKLIKTMLNKNS